MSDLSDRIREAIELAIPDDLDGWRERYTDKAVSNVMALLVREFTDWDRDAIAVEIRKVADMTRAVAS